MLQNKMAIEIKRTPVLEGNASQAFLNSLKGDETTKVSNEQVLSAIEISKKIMKEFKAKSH